VGGEIQPNIECAIFADTGEEPDAVYRHLEWMKSCYMAVIRRPAIRVISGIHRSS